MAGGYFEGYSEGAEREKLGFDQVIYSLCICEIVKEQIKIF